MLDVAAGLAEVRSRIAGAAAGVGRTDGITLVAVSKSVPLHAVRAAYAAGQRVFGENRVQEGAEKRETLQQGTWHLVGHLQTNKVRRAVQTFDVVQSVDSARLARKLHDAALSREVPLPVLLEVNVAGEASKSGFLPQAVEQVLPELLGLNALQLRGLMTVAPLVPDPDDVRWVFRDLRELRERLSRRFGLESFDQLSMGMSDDFEVAVEEGATIVRIGRAIFGERPPARG